MQFKKNFFWLVLFHTLKLFQRNIKYNSEKGTFDKKYEPFTDKVTDSLTFLSPFKVLVAKQEYFFMPSSAFTDLICKSPVPEVTAYRPATKEIYFIKNYPMATSQTAP